MGVVLTERGEDGKREPVKRQKKRGKNTGTRRNARLRKRRGQRRDCAIPAHLVNLSHLVQSPSVHS